MLWSETRSHAWRTLDALSVGLCKHCHKPTNIGFPNLITLNFLQTPYFSLLMRHNVDYCYSCASRCLSWFISNYFAKILYNSSTNINRSRYLFHVNLDFWLAPVASWAARCHITPLRFGCPKFKSRLTDICQSYSPSLPLCFLSKYCPKAKMPKINLSLTLQI